MSDPQINILLGTYNGAQYLEDQLRSFEDQTYQNWVLWVSDDGSSDATLEMIDAFSRRNPGRVTVLSGPKEGAAANYLTLLGKIKTGPNALIAFSDQDDVWMPQKLARAVDGLDRLEGDLRVYSCRSIHVDPDMKKIGQTRHFKKPACFANALVQNILSGHSLVLNHAAFETLCKSAPAAIAADVPFHDWWTYLILSGAGAAICFDQEATVFYRQHGGNLLGGNHGHRSVLTRLSMAQQGKYGHWIRANSTGLHASRGLLTPDNQELFDRFRARLEASYPRRLVAGVGDIGVYRQSPVSNLALGALMRAGRI